MHSPITAGHAAGATTAEIMQRLAACEGPRIVGEPRQTLDRLIAQRMEQAPDAVAVLDDGVETSFRGLLDRAAGLRETLRGRGVARGVRVGICLQPSVDLLAATIAVWSLGATSVALDPALPKARIEQITIDAALATIFVTSTTAEGIDPSAAVDVAQTAPVQNAAFTSDARLGDVAYVVYTSGSTGVPKGVAVRHDALANAILAAADVHQLDARDRQLCRTSIAFDAAMLEIFVPLVMGGRAIIAPRASCGDPHAFIALMIAHDITSIVLGPSFLAALLDAGGLLDCTSLRVVVCGGEGLSIGLCRRFFATSSAALYNCYGPSEATILVTSHRCRASDAASGEETAPLGRPLANTHVSIRDGDLNPVAPGAVGEIVIGGVQLATEYINKPVETALRFVADPLRPDERLYRTGDLARLGYDGSIIFTGRNDKQVKIRGQRVEPAEIAAAIEQLDGVSKAAVLARPRSGADDALVLIAYVAPRTGASLNPHTLRNILRSQLPSSMVPAEIVIIDAFPLTLTGKIDEAALAQRDDVPAPRLVRAAVTRTEPSVILREQLRVIWEELLDFDGFGDDDDFFDLGGDSMLAVTLMMRLEETFGRRASFADFFDAMTIAGLAELLSTNAELREREAVTFNDAGSLPPLVYLHGDHGGGMYAWSLAAMLGDAQPLLVIPPHGLAGRPPASDVETMAADVIAIATKYHPTGPIRLAGYSAAGFVAYEAARQLRRAGRDVLDVVIIGMGARSVGFRKLDAAVRQLRLPHVVRDAVVHGAMTSVNRLARLMRVNVRDIRAGVRRALGALSKEPAASAARESIEQAHAYIRYVNAHKFHIPRPYDGRVTVLWPQEQPDQIGDTRNWLRIAPQAEIAYVAGTHHVAVSRHLHQIAAAMQGAFREQPQRF